MWNTLASFCGANLLMLLVPVNRTISWKQFVDNKFALLVFGVVFSSNIVTNNASLVYISLSVNQVIKCLVPPPASADRSLAQKQPRERPRPRAPALVRCCILHGLAFPGLYDLRGNLDGLPVLQEGHRCRDGYPDWRIHLRFRVQHRRILPRESDVFADVRCARKPEDHLDHRDCRAAVGQGDFPDECRRLRYLLPGSLRLLVPDLQEQAAGPKTCGDGAGEGDDEARELIERPCVALRSARDIIQLIIQDIIQVRDSSIAELRNVLVV